GRTRMTDTLKARDAKDVENAVQWALGEGKALEILGHGSKRAIGRPPQPDVVLDLSALSGVLLYEPEELVLSAKAGTPIAEIEVKVKALPMPETETTVVMHGLDDAAASRVMAAAMGSSCEVSGAAHLPAATAARFPMGDAVAAGRALTALRLEGVAPSVAQR